MNVVDKVHASMAKKAKESLEYHMGIWESHINQLGRLVVSDKVPNGLHFDRYIEIKKELLKAAEAQWSE